MARGPVPLTSERLNPTEYWSNHTVHVENQFLSSAKSSLEYFHWRCDQYPGYLELMPVSGLDGLDVLDYGCGPGHDLVGIATYSKPATLIGLDVSERALAIAQQRITIHGFGEQVHARKLDMNRIELSDDSVDYIHSSGVLQHVRDLQSVLAEFKRVLRPEGRVRIMVYNRDSLWWHLYVPYVMQIRKRILDPFIPLPEAFRMSTDGFDCPISVAYTTGTFSEIAELAGFNTELVGTSISITELDAWSQYAEKAKKDERLASEHRDFLRSIHMDLNSRLSSTSGRVPGINLVLELTPRRDTSCN